MSSYRWDKSLPLEELIYKRKVAFISDSNAVDGRLELDIWRQLLGSDYPKYVKAISGLALINNQPFRGTTDYYNQKRAALVCHAKRHWQSIEYLILMVGICDEAVIIPLNIEISDRSFKKFTDVEWKEKLTFTASDKTGTTVLKSSDKKEMVSKVQSFLDYIRKDLAKHLPMLASIGLCSVLEREDSCRPQLPGLYQLWNSFLRAAIRDHNVRCVKASSDVSIRFIDLRRCYFEKLDRIFPWPGDAHRCSANYIRIKDVIQNYTQHRLEFAESASTRRKHRVFR